MPLFLPRLKSVHRPTIPSDPSFANVTRATSDHLVGMASNHGHEHFFAHPELRLGLETKFLDSLYFPEIASRQEAIQEPCPNTFDWALHGRLSGRHQGHPLADWLEKGNSTYWVSGKAGSGKSTLMRHLILSQNVKSMSRTPADQHQTYSFFFWKPGSVLQHSTRGLLRAILYQVCDRNRGVISKLAQECQMKDMSSGVWTEQSLRSALHSAVRTLPNIKFTLFVDGLDELTGERGDNLNELLNFMLSLQAEPNLRLCVSSRPKASIESKLGKYPRLYLEHLNSLDIETYVDNRFADYPGLGEVRSAIIDAAGGVFLWVVLACDSLKDGLAHYDDRATLLARLEVLPATLHGMYMHAAMSHRVDGMLVQRLAHTIRCILEFQRSGFQAAGIPLAYVAAAAGEGDLQCLQDFFDNCKNLEVQIVAQSQGLDHKPRADVAYADPIRTQTSRNRY